jgi:hypothetical protein
MNGSCLARAFRERAIHEVTCEILEPSQICFIEKEPYLELIRSNPALALFLLTQHLLSPSF